MQQVPASDRNYISFFKEMLNVDATLRPDLRKVMIFFPKQKNPTDKLSFILRKLSMRSTIMQQLSLANHSMNAFRDLDKFKIWFFLLLGRNRVYSIFHIKTLSKAFDLNSRNELISNIANQRQTKLCHSFALIACFKQTLLNFVVAKTGYPAEKIKKFPFMRNAFDEMLCWD